MFGINTTLPQLNEVADGSDYEVSHDPIFSWLQARWARRPSKDFAMFQPGEEASSEP